MTKLCSECGSDQDVQLVYNHHAYAGRWMCYPCATKAFPPGSRVVRFSDISGIYPASCYIGVNSDDDLEAILQMSRRAQMIDATNIQAQFYTVWRRNRKMVPKFVSLGHKYSLVSLRENIDSLRVWLTASEIINMAKD